MGTKDITIILPAAGKGSRLRLDYPKELYKIKGNISLIDLSLKHILAFYQQKKSQVKVEVGVVITKAKETVFQYVSKMISPIKVRRIYFNEKYSEWPGSVFSAKDFLSHNNLVLLPDSFLALADNKFWIDKKGQTLAEISIRILRKSSVFFGYLPTTNQDQLRSLGALKSNGSQIQLFCDKPKKDIDQYNGYWGCYGFRKDKAKELYEFLIACVNHQKIDYSKMSFYPAAGIQLFEYQDLGTRQLIDRFKRNKKDWFQTFTQTIN